MSGEYWSNEDKLRLKKLHIDPVRSPPERLKEMVNYFRKPGASVFAITEGDGPPQGEQIAGQEGQGLPG